MSFIMQLYYADENSINSPVPGQEGIVDWLLKNAKCLGEIEFETGECFTFFRALYLLCEKDLLPLIGGSVHDPPTEDEYCCGSVNKQILHDAVNKLHEQMQSADPGEEFQPCSHYLQSQGVSDEWFQQVLRGFLGMINSVPEEGTILGLFE